MKFTANRKELLEALTLTGKAINKSIIPAIMGYRFTITSEKLTITGGNMEMYIHSSIDIDSDFEATLIVPKQKVFDLVKELNDPQLEFSITVTELETVKSFRMTITSQSGKYNMPIEEGKDYPEFDITTTTDFNVKSDDLVMGIDKTLFACATEGEKLNLTAIYLQISAGRAVYVAANGAVLSAQPIGSADTDETHDVLLPKSAAAVVKDLPKDENVDIQITNNTITFKLSDDLTFQSILIDEKYPNYKSLIQSKNDKHLHIDRKQLMSSIKRVTMFSSEQQNNGIALRFADKSLQVLVNNDVEGTAIETLEASYEGEAITVGFNGKVLLTALDKIDSEIVYADFSNEKLGMLLHDGSINLNDKENFILVMPVLLHANLAKVS